MSQFLSVPVAQVIGAGLAVAVVERTEVNRDVGQGDREVARGRLRRWGRPSLRRSPVCGGRRAAAGIASGRHVGGS